MGCDPACSQGRQGIHDFNPRTHVGCDGGGEKESSKLEKFQSTHPRGVRHAYGDGQPRRAEISIHAPTWGATWNQQMDSTKYQNFNPRTHVGCDQLVMCPSTLPNNFNPRTHVGCDCVISDGVKGSTDFNPRTHVGCDSDHSSDISTIDYFNPRTHVGCDSYPKLYAIAKRIFQSTHPRGVRPCLLNQKGFTPVFQSTHPRGVRHLITSSSDKPANFNPRTHVGCDVKA